MGEPTEWTYEGELLNQIKEIGRKLGFDAEQEMKIGKGRVDLLLKFNEKPVAVIEIKRPDVDLSDSSLIDQALRYADSYRRHYKDLKFFIVHNMKYADVYKWDESKGINRQTSLMDFMEGSLKQRISNWVRAFDFPLPIIPKAKSIADYKMISTTREGRENLERFLIRLKEIIEGKTFDLTEEVIERIHGYIEDAANAGAVEQLFNSWKKDNETKTLVTEILKEKGIDIPDTDDEMKERLQYVLKEAIYTFVMKVMFYYILQTKDADMANKLKQDIAELRPSDPELFKKIFDEVFRYAIERTGDFEEVFKSNTVDRLTIPPAALSKLDLLLDFLRQISWSTLRSDVIGKIFEKLIHEERRHLLGQYYTKDIVADLIVSQIDELGTILDPACGSGTFLVRAFNYLSRNNNPRKVLENLRGIDIDRLAVMLAKINLYIIGLEEIRNGFNFKPNVIQRDYFQERYEADYIITNPPYTRQEEMKMAYFNKEYKRTLEEVVKDIEGWSKKASIYAYFIVKSLKEAKKGIGYLVENSWLNAEYGKPLRERLFSNNVETIVIEPLTERWFDDARVNTNIIITKKYGNLGIHTIVFLKKSLKEIIGDPPPSSDSTATEKYYKRIRGLFEKWKKISENQVLDDDGVKIVRLSYITAQKIEDKLGRYGFLRGPKSYVELILKYLGGDQKLVKLGDVIEIKRGLTTNANDYFYLPSKFWSKVNDTDNYLEVRNGPQKLRISKNYLRPLIRLDHIKDSTYEISSVPRLGKEDYVIWIENLDEVQDQGAREYAEWVLNKWGNNVPSALKKKERSKIFSLPDVSGHYFIFRNAINLNYAIYLNRQKNYQIDERLYVGRPKLGTENENLITILFGLLNSTITYLGIELFGRSNLGEGALDVKTVDYEVVPIPSPQLFMKFLEENSLQEKFMKSVKKLMTRKPLNIEDELKQDDRKAIDEIAFKFLWKEPKNVQKEIYEGILELSLSRVQRSEKVLGKQAKANVKSK
ncbi:HsdM family class I SAM-dependent methyltransferase [Saccharolobus islandicus]|uniref:HsdM family class I SAM-dependent methyltransferase n=1 Tax=Saccharolobus islandicus TaxID=43080 RepID=UPI0004940F34|nr:N-6 DNA methylase [Sulfolobus islandicus]